MFVRRQVLLVGAAAVVLGGCSSFSQTVGGWFGSTPEPTATPAATQAGETFYSAVAGLSVYAEPSAATKIVGRLALHERVTRAGIERGYAHITASTSGVTGWVDNAQLLWRLPTAPAKGAPAAAQPAEPPAEASAAPPAAATPVATLSVPTPEEPTLAVPPPPTATSTPARKPGAEPAIFDPF